MNKLLKTFLILAVLTGSVYLINAAVIFFTQPANIQQGEYVDVEAQYGTVSVALIDDLKAGGLGGLSVGTIGYVNVMSPQQLIYLDGKKHETAPRQNSYIFRHEYAHILQKNIVAEKAGGYPSYDNPIKSFIYYFYLFKLNNDLAALMPTDNHDAATSSPFTGLELSADCYAQKIEYVGHPMQYVGSVGCDAEQRYIAIALISGRWPDPLTEDEKQEAAERDQQRQEPTKKAVGNPSKSTQTVLETITKQLIEIAEHHTK